MKVLAPLEITAAAPGIQKKVHGSGRTTLIISNEEMDDIMKIVQALKDSNIFLKGVKKIFENETKEPKGGFLGMLLDTLGARFLGNTLTKTVMLKTGYRHKKEKEIVRAAYGKGMLRAGCGNKNFYSRPIL